MKKAIWELLALASTAVLLAACAPITSLPRNSDADNARTSAQEAEMAAMQMPEYAQAVAAQAEAAKTIHDPRGLISWMVQITDIDRMSVKAGLEPTSVLSYDAELIRMMIKPATLDAHQRDPAWTKRKKALFAARDAALQAYTAAVVQKGQREARMYDNIAQLYGTLSDQQRKENADRAAAHQDYMDQMGAVAAPSCIPVSGEGWQGCVSQ